MASPDSRLEEFLIQDLFTSPVITLRVGAMSQEMTAHKVVLVKVPFFRACLESDRFTEGATNIINMPEEDFDAATQLIYFLYAGKLQHSVITSNMSDKDSNDIPIDVRIFATNCRTYVLADKLMIEGLGNLIIDWMTVYFTAYCVFFDDLKLFADASMIDSPLGKLLALKMAQSTMEIGGWDRYRDTMCTDLDDRCDTYPAVSWSLARALTSAGSRTGPKVKNNACKWHVHKASDKCASAVQPEKHGLMSLEQWLAQNL